MLKKDYKNKSILVVTHVGIIYAIHRILKMPKRMVNNLEIVEIVL